MAASAAVRQTAVRLDQGEAVPNVGDVGAGQVHPMRYVLVGTWQQVHQALQVLPRVCVTACVVTDPAQGLTSSFPPASFPVPCALVGADASTAKEYLRGYSVGSVDAALGQLQKSRGLHSPLRVGALPLAHRVVLAPLTRMRCAGRLPDKLVVEYYAQRATPGGLLVSEGVHPSPQAVMGWNTPILASREQARAWVPVTQAVHAKGGFIFAQLWHVGRQSHSRYQPSQELPVSASARGMAQKMPVPAADGSGVQMLSADVPRALETREIPGVIAQFRRSAVAAKEAGFDGVELHAANGYLIDQFLAGNVNARNDAYGADRTLLLRQVVEELIGVWGRGRVGVRLAPGGSFGEVSSADAPELFARACRMLDSLGIAYLHIIEPGTQGSPRQNAKYPGDVRLKHATAKLRASFAGPIISAGMRTKELWSSSVADAFAFGRPFITNPDLVERLRVDAPLTKLKSAKRLYGDFMPRSKWAKGYVDYPVRSKL